VLLLSISALPHVPGLFLGARAGTGNDPRDRSFRTVTQGERYDPDAQLIAAWLPPLRALRPARLAHRPWEAPGEALEAAGLRLVRDPQQGEERGAAGQAGAWYPLPVVDPATQIGKGPKRGARGAQQRDVQPKQQQQQQQQQQAVKPLQG
jgi:hypothetical protein